MNELKIIRKASIVDANTETTNAVYNIRFQYDEYDDQKNLQAVHVEIADRQEEGNLMNIGSMDYNSGNISMAGFPYSEKTTTFMSEFSDIVEEIKSLIK